MKPAEAGENQTCEVVREVVGGPKSLPMARMFQKGTDESPNVRLVMLLIPKCRYKSPIVASSRGKRNQGYVYYL